MFILYLSYVEGREKIGCGEGVGLVDNVIFGGISGILHHLLEFWSLIICVIVFYDVFLCCVVVSFKLLIMSVSNLLVILLVGDSGGMEYFS